MSTAPFPRGFVWGAATAAFQIEGAADADGRGDSIWDTFCREPGRIAGGDDARVAADHYHRWAEDLDLARAIGLQAYRFSVAWPRVQPSAGVAAHAAGLGFYDRLVDGLLERGIQPHATLYHWDLPQWVQDEGGWPARTSVARFVDYAQAVGARLGDRLASIATFNEPHIVSHHGHRLGDHAPGRRDPQAALDAVHHMLLAHGRAMTALRTDGVRAPLGIAHAMGPVHPRTPQPADRRAAERLDLLINRLHVEPLLDGRYPDRLAELLGGEPAQREGDAAEIAAPLDFLGINYYARHLASAAADAGPAPALPPGAQVTAMGWEVWHEGLCELLAGLKARHANLPPVLITESGCACDDVVVDGRVDDVERVAYLQGQIAALGRAVDRGVDVRGYFVWSLLDNFEWTFGHAKRFGLVHVDRRTLARTPKLSARWYGDFIARERDRTDAQARRAAASGPTSR